VILRRCVRTFGLLAAAGAAALGACTSSTTSTTYTPITGILINSATLVAGFGCGQEPGEVYRYGAVVTFPTDAGGAGEPVTQNGMPLTNIFQCWTNGVFENLPSSDSGSLTFNVTIFAYNQDDYNDAGLPSDLGCPPVFDGGTCTPGSLPITSAQETAATWRTPVGMPCTATQQAGTPVFAVCPPLQRNAPPLDGGAASADAARDGAVDAEPDATGLMRDATVTMPDASAADGGTSSPDAADASADGTTISNDG
jgi:hypothetical protein